MFHQDIYHISLTVDYVQETNHIYPKHSKILLNVWMLFRNAFF